MPKNGPADARIYAYGLTGPSASILAGERARQRLKSAETQRGRASNGRTRYRSGEQPPCLRGGQHPHEALPQRWQSRADLASMSHQRASASRSAPTRHGKSNCRRTVSHQDNRKAGASDAYQCCTARHLRRNRHSESHFPHRRAAHHQPHRYKRTGRASHEQR